MGLPRGDDLNCRYDVITIRNIMKNREYLHRRIIPSMDIALLRTTTDIEQLRAMALAMVQKAVDEKHTLQLQKNTELMAKEQRIHLLEEGKRTIYNVWINWLIPATIMSTIFSDNGHRT